MNEPREEANGNAPPAWKQHLQPLAAELNRMLALRRELATLEIAHDRQLLRRGVIVGGIGAVMAMAGLPTLLQAAARALAAVTTLSITAWTVMIGSLSLVLGLLLLAHAVRKTRSGFCGLRGTRAELNEDLIWLREWAQSEESQADAQPDAAAAENHSRV